MYEQGHQMITGKTKVIEMTEKNPLEDLTNAGDYYGIENRIKEVNVSLPTSDNTKITGRFFYLDFRNHTPNQKTFVDYIFTKIDRYCIPRQERNRAKKRYQETQDESVFTTLHDQAIKLFVYSNNKRGAHLGEPAELIAFILLEAFLGAPQIASKMFLKTNTAMPVHGADAIHMRYHKETGCLDLLWGEAKLYENLNDGISNALESIRNFIKVDDKTGNRQRDRDIEIIKDFPDVDDEDMRRAICDYFDPYSDKAGNIQDIYVCFVGYDETLYKCLVGTNDKEIEEYFKVKYIQKAVNTYNSFVTKIEKNSELSGLQFIVLLLPFNDINSLRDDFKAKLRVNPDD